MKIKAIFFDYGRVIADYDFSIFAKRIEPFSTFSYEEILDKLFSGTLFRRYSNGFITSNDFFEGLKKKMRAPNLKYKIFKKAWTDEMLYIPNKDIKKVFSSIKSEIKLFILSTNNDLHWGFHNQNAALLKKYFPYPRQRVLSHKVGASKPELKIFKTAISRSGCDSKETIFIDNNKEYLAEFKKKTGGNVIHYNCQIHSIGYLLSKLRKFNVLKK